MKLNLKMTAQFFDKPVVNAVKNAARRVLGKFGAYVRNDARKSIKQGKRKSESELTDEERKRYRIRLSLFARGKIAKEPLLPWRSSRPGSSPLAHGPKSPIRLILFAYDPVEQSVVVGPVAFGSRPGVATESLEYGGPSVTYGRRISVAARPNIVPAHEKNLPHLRAWRNAL